MAKSGISLTIHAPVLLLVLLMVPQVRSLVYPGCHNLTVELVNWIGDGDREDGRNCDNALAGKQCDPIFYFCVDHKTPSDGSSRQRWSGTSMSECRYSETVKRTKEFHNRNSLTFPVGTGALGRGLSNPFKFHFQHKRWAKARVYVKVEDEDLGGDDDIDEHLFTLNGAKLDGNENKWAYPFSESVFPHRWINKTIRGTYHHKTSATMTLSYKVICCQDYYNYDCSVFCLPQNNTQHGFYTCDPKTGDRVCLPGYLDPTTDPPCVSRFDYCSTFVCYNGGTHYPQPHLNRCDCICPPGTTGHRCQTIVDNCPDPSPCQNGGTCISFLDTFRCSCPAFHTGDICEFTKCQDNTLVCKNNGTCVEELQGCRCLAPFTGVDCNQCDCSDHGQCDLAQGKCICNKGWIGPSCQVDVCDVKTCLNGGKCIAGDCVCKQDYTGIYCESPIGACDSNPCQNDATCNPLKEGYKCECKIRNYGSHCEHTIPADQLLTDNDDDDNVLIGASKDDSGDSDSNYWIYVIIGLVVMILIVVILVALLWRQKRKRRQAEAAAQTNAQNADGMANFCNPLYGNESRGAQTQATANGAATQTYDNMNIKGTPVNGKVKGIHDDENPYDNIGGEGNQYDYPPSKAPALPTRSVHRGGTDKSTGRLQKPPAYIAELPPYTISGKEQGAAGIDVVSTDYAEPVPSYDEDDDPATMKKKMADRFSKA